MKKKLIILIPILVCIFVFIGVYAFFNYEDKTTSLTVFEKKWIDNNNSTKVNLDIINDMPVLGFNGKGLLFDFAKDFEIELGLGLSRISYSKENQSAGTELRFRILANNTELTEKDLLLLEDGYVLIGYENNRYDDLKQIKSKTIGTLATDVAELTYYMKSSSNITFKSFTSIDELITALTKKEVNMIVVPQLMYLEEIIKLNNTYINYYFTEMNKKVVLTLTDNNDKLNGIIKKYFETWKKKNYVESYNDAYLEYYASAKNWTDKQKTAVVTKNYVYGYVENAPYQVKLDGEVFGIAGEYIERIKRLAGIDVTYKSYKNNSELAKAIANKEVDIFFDNFGINTNEYKATMSPFVEKYVIIAKAGSDKNVSSFESLKNQTINILDTNLILNYFKDNSKANLVIKNNINALKNNNLIAIDKEIYSYYKNTKFAKYEVLYEDYITNDFKFYVSNNLVDFYDIFNYIIGTNSYYNYRNVGLSSINVSIVERTSFEQLYLIVLGLVFLPILILLALYLFLKRKRKVREVRKEDRRKYTDMLTSLKNRNYLNLHMEEWENCNVYPQGIMVIDLNNLKYVNDNHGHEEGDKLIAKAASILVNTQVENSEIIRTDGNEFLIYLVGYTSKQVSLYSTKLTKELKNLPYGFGATIGFSMIEDDIKTIDDAINEATLDMRNKKEENK